MTGVIFIFGRIFCKYTSNFTLFLIRLTFFLVLYLQFLHFF
nr:MAG TPA: hypothetical protein [Caudoviricetes sp.]